MEVEGWNTYLTKLGINGFRKRHNFYIISISAKYIKYFKTYIASFLKPPIDNPIDISKLATYPKHDCTYNSSNILFIFSGYYLLLSYMILA